MPILPRFLILSLPRCRTAWLARYLSPVPFRVMHDPALGCAGVADFVRRLYCVDGAIDTGAGFGWRLWRRMLPETELIVLRRPLAEVAASLVRLGLDPDWLTLTALDTALRECARETGAWSLTAGQLDDRAIRRELYRRCLGTPFDEVWDAGMIGRNIQIGPERLQAALACLPQTHAFLNAVAECAAMIPVAA